MNICLSSREALIAQIPNEVSKALDDEIMRLEIESGTACPKARFNRVVIEDTLIAELRYELEYCDEQNLVDCVGEDGRLSICDLFNQIENPTYEDINDYFRESYTSPSQSLVDWLNRNMKSGLESWVDELVSYPSIEEVRIAHGVKEWNRQLIMQSLIEGLHELAYAGELRTNDTVLDILGVDGKFTEFFNYIAASERELVAA